jgi:uncharacterized Zn finger protein (UPF0148 family)
MLDPNVTDHCPTCGARMVRVLGRARCPSLGACGRGGSFESMRRPVRRRHRSVVRIEQVRASRSPSAAAAS